MKPLKHEFLNSYFCQQPWNSWMYFLLQLVINKFPLVKMWPLDNINSLNECICVLHTKIVLLT